LEEEWCVGEVEEDDEVCVLLAMVDVLGDCNVFVVVVVAVEDDDDFLVVVVVVARGDFSTSTIVAVGVEDVAGVDEGGDAEKERREEEDVLGDVSFFCNG